MTTQCRHPRTGVVSDSPAPYACEIATVAPVCDRPECIADATAWVELVSRKPAYHVPAAQKAEVSA